MLSSEHVVNIKISSINKAVKSVLVMLISCFKLLDEPDRPKCSPQ